MRRNYKFLVLSLSLFILLASCVQETKKVDVLIVGGGASGIAAGIQSANEGCTTLIVEESPWLGGMLTSAGVSAIDGNYRMRSGIWGVFLDSLVAHYGSLEAINTGWVSNVLFEPSVGNEIFQKMSKAESALEVYQESGLIKVSKQNDVWLAEIKKGNSTEVIEAKVLIDATELGDVAKMCGVAYDYGMDSRSKTNESVAPEEGNDIIQDLTYVAVLKDYKKDVTIERPANYDSTLFACAAINDLCITPKEHHRQWEKNMMITYGKLPNDKYMINWPIEGNDYYLNLIELTKDEREVELQKAKDFTMSFLYFIQKDLGFNTLGLADDEFPTEDLLPFIPYHRESRRIDGLVKFGLNDIKEPYSQVDKLYRTTIGVGDYPIDHHHKRNDDYENLPDLFIHAVPSFGLPLGALIPKNIEGLIVAEKSISVTNIVNGTTRLQPVILQIGQAAGALAALSVKQDKKIADVSVRDVQKKLLDNGTYILPYLDVDKTDDNFKVYQRIGATGILQGEGKTIAWSNETWLRINDPLLASEIEGLKDLYPNYKPLDKTELTYDDAAAILLEIAGAELDADKSNILEDYRSKTGIITRGEFAYLVDKVLDPFNTFQVDIKGNIKN